MTDKALARQALLDLLAEHPAERAQRRASLTLAGKARGTTRHAADTAELLRWLDMLGLPPCEREMRPSKKWKAKR